MLRRCLLPTVVLGSCLLGAAGRGAVIDVGPGQLFTTLAGAYAAASGGDTLRLHDGVYSGGLTVAKPIRIEAVNVGGAIVDGPGFGPDLAVFGVRAQASFSGLVLRHAEWGLYQRDAGVHFTAERCIILDCSGALGINNSAGTSGSIDASHLTIFDVGTAASINDGGTIRLTNSIIASTALAYGAHNNVAIIPSHNLLFDVTTVTAGGGTILADPDQLLADPEFLNVGALDFGLNPTSPAVDTGLDLGAPFFGLAPDRGAFESVPEPASLVSAAMGALLLASWWARRRAAGQFTSSS
jgi:hypothetical protein